MQFLSWPSCDNFNLNFTISHDKLFIFLKRNNFKCARALGVLFPFIGLVYIWGSWKLEEDSVAEGKTLCMTLMSPIHMCSCAQTHTHRPPSGG